MDTLSNHIDHLSQFRKNFIPILILTLLSAIVYTSAVYNNGLGITDDSVNYLHAASSFIKQYKLLKVDNTPFTEWPPLYPLLLSLAKYTPLSLITFTSVFHGILFTLNTFLAFYLFSYFLKNRLLLYAAGITWAFSTPTLLTHVFVWSEPAFISLLLLSLIILFKYLNQQQPRYFIWLVVISILLYLQRKSGLLFILSHASILFLLYPSSIYKKIKIVTIYLVPTIGCIIIWNLIRLSIAGKVFGVAYWDPLQLKNTIYETLNTLSSWWLPDEIPLAIRLTAIGLATGILIYYLYIRRKEKNGLFLKIIILTFFNYLLLLNLLLTYVHINDPVDDRILSPVYIPAFIIIFVLIEKLVDQLPKLKPLIYATLIAWLLYPVIRTSYHIMHWNEVGPGGYNLIATTESALGRQIQELKNAEVIYTNHIYQAYYLILKGNNDIEIININSSANNKSGLYVCFGQTNCSDIAERDKIIIYKDNQGEIFKLK